MLPVADRWFEMESLSNGITRLWEPHVVPLVRCNIWHVKGRNRDLMIDTGLGVASLHDAMHHLLDRRVTAVATHTHLDHVGGHHEFEHTLVYQLEADNLRSPAWRGALLAEELGTDLLQKCKDAGYEVDGPLLTGLPCPGYDMNKYRVEDSTVSEIVQDGDIVDLGNRAFEVLHLPGHSPGSIGLWEASSGTFSRAMPFTVDRCLTILMIRILRCTFER